MKANLTLKSESNYQDVLKLLAIITMIIDHIGLYVFADIEYLRIIGRMAMPIFCFFAGYNFHNYPKLKILIAGIILAITNYYLVIFYTTPNILISIFLGQCYIYLMKIILKKSPYFGLIQSIILLSFCNLTFDFFGYGTVAIAIMVLGYTAKQYPESLKITTLLTVLITSCHIYFIGYRNTSLIIAISIMIFEYLLFIWQPFNKKISINLKLVTRYALEIYVIHLLILQIIFYIMVVSKFYN